MTDFLEAILSNSRRRVAALLADPPAGARRAAGRFRQALAGPGPIRLIAEIKRSSPSRGTLVADLDAAALGRAYRRGGAAALSVLTEPDFFAGSAKDLRDAAAASGLPVLRKDFLLEPVQIAESADLGADAVLLIVRILPGASLVEMIAAARRAGLDALVEVHDLAELDRALVAGADLIGVNRRDLRTFAVDADRPFALADRLPAEVVRVAESGVRSAADVGRLASAGYHAVLVGEHLVCAAEPETAVRELLR